MTSPDESGTSGRAAADAAQIARLERRIERERAAREEAERIAERGMRDLWSANRELEDRVAQRTEQLEQTLAAVTMATEAKERFLAELGHELTTPLHAVLGILELTDPESLDEVNRNNLAEVQTHASQLAELLHSLVELAGAEGAPTPESFVEQRPVDWLDEAVGDWTKRAAARGQLLVPTAVGRSEPTSADWLRLRRMLDAVMSNVTWHATAGAVTISLETTDDHVVLTVSDSGPGMSHDQLATALEPFVSFSESAGVGIGLTIADRLARAASGTLDVSSSDAGTTVVMSLPHR